MRAVWVLGLICGLSSWAEAGSLRCDGHLVGTGDSVLELKARCGAPDHIESRTRLVAQGFQAPALTAPVDARRGIQATSQTFRQVRYVREEIQIWTYASDGRSFARTVTVRRGRVQDVTAVGPLEAPEDPRCSRAVLSAQARVGMVHLACGAPDDRAVWEEERELQVGGAIRRMLIQHERWTYNPGAGRLLRVLEFENGRLVRQSTGPRSPSLQQ